jgi:hydrogenase expression/formation protein HypC
MCLGIVGQVVALESAPPDLAEVEVAGARRNINIGIIAAEGIAPGDWILIHAGFAMEKIDAETAATQLTALREYTGGPEPDPVEGAAAAAPEDLEGAAPSAPGLGWGGGRTA